MAWSFNTSLNVELGVDKIDEAQVQQKIIKHFSNLFEAQFKEAAFHN